MSILDLSQTERDHALIIFLAELKVKLVILLMIVETTVIETVESHQI